MTSEKLDFDDIDPYEVLGAHKNASQDEIKKAYRRAAIKTHPDKAKTDQERLDFHGAFQQVAFAYSVLSDEKRRKRYDNTGSLDDSDLSDESSFQDLFSELCKTEITEEMIEQDKKEYREGGEERADILKYYKEGRGDLDVVFENVLHTDILEDEKRVRGIIEEAIANGEVKSYSKFKKEPDSLKKKRRRDAEKEAEEAEELAKELNIKRPSGEDDLALMIKKRHESRFSSMIANLEQKYAPKPKKSNPKAKGKSKKT